MKRSLNLALALLLASAIAVPATAQFLPLPKSAQEPAAICTGCTGTNRQGEANDGLPMVGYSSPIARHVGRLVDSSSTTDYQHAHPGYDFRTARAGSVVVVAPNQRGSAPPRAYVKLGSAVTAHDLDALFTTDLPGGTVHINSLVRIASLHHATRSPYEKVTKWDAHIYPENPSSGWTLAFADGQDRLGEFDIDDRGYIYAAYMHYGIGIVRDDGSGGGATDLPLVHQILPEQVILTPEHLLLLKNGTKYYVIASDFNAYQSVTFDVTSPTSPGMGVLRKGSQWGFKMARKDPTSERFAYIDGTKKLHIYETSAFVAGGAAIATYSEKFAALTFDDNGTIWAAEENTPNLWRLTPSGGGYTKQVFSAGSAPFVPTVIHASAGFVALGYEVPNYVTTPDRDLALFKVENGQPRLLDTNKFFRHFYHAAPSGYGQAPFKPVNYQVHKAVHLTKYAGKVYLFYNSHGVGDVYELEAGDSINVSNLGVGGTPNPNAQSSGLGPFYGDPVKFKGTSSNPASQFRLAWDFGNLEAGSGAFLNSDLNEVVQYQYTGLDTVAKIQQPKKGTVASVSDLTISSPFTVTLEVPKTRIAIADRSGTIPPTGAFEVVAGEKFIDASDGSVEGHFATWTIDGTSTNLLPNAQIDVGALGTHTLSFTASYGKYDPTTFIAVSPYVDKSIANLSYTVRPFIATLLPPTRSGTNVTFSGEGRYASDTQIFNSSQWVVKWFLDDVLQGQAQTVNVGTIPDLTLAQSAIPSGSVLKLEVSVDPSAVPSTTYASHSATMMLSPPDPIIQVSGCTHAGSPCTLTAASSTVGGSTADWQFAWVVKSAGTTIKTGSEKTLSLSLSQSGTYVVTLTATKTVFDVAVQEELTVAAALCGPPPSELQLAIAASCSSNCPPNEPITFSASLYQYVAQDCDVFEWNFGDGSGTETGVHVTHAFSTAKTYTVRLTARNSSGSPAVTVSKSISVGAVSPPPPTCSAPNSVGLTYHGNKGCAPGTPCKTGESITFTGLKNGMALQSCDSAHWSFGDAMTSTLLIPSHTYANSGTYGVTLTVTNSSGTQTSQPVTITVVQDTGGGCPLSPNQAGFYIDYKGATSGCAAYGSKCKQAEAVQFYAKPFGYTFQTCDKFEWNFGDGSPVSTERDPIHAFIGTAQSYTVKLRLYNDNDMTGVTISHLVEFENTVPVKPLPVLSAAQFPGAGAKGSAVTFTATSDVVATDWEWDFGDGTKKNSSVAGTSSTMTHTYATTGSFTVTVKARNAEDAATAPKSLASNSIKIDDIPTYRYLLPVVAHIGGQNGSAWRTDVQVYNPDPNVSASNPLRMTAEFQGTPTALEIPQSTFIYEDFMRHLAFGNNSGPVIITARTQYAPQIWTRTYNKTENGTFGQFIPAIRLDDGGGAANVGGTGNYYLAGLRSDGRFRSNVGMLNVTGQPITATVKIYDDEGFEVGKPAEHTLHPFVPVQFAAGGTTRPFTVEIVVPDGQWIVAYASLVDGDDPAFVQAVRASDLTSSDYRNIVLPGIGHLGTWRSDVTIFNPYGRGVNVDLAYHDAAGAKVAEAKSVPIGGGEFLQYTDILKAGILGDVADSIGILKITVPSTITPDYFPMAVARTYSDNGDGKTFGQGVAAIAAPRANVRPNKPALIAGVRDIEETVGSHTTGYYTNLGAVNVSDTEVVVTFTVLDAATGARGTPLTHTLQPNASILTRLDLGNADFASVEVSVTGGSAWAFASIVDRGTQDPEYVPATPLVP